MTRVAVLPPPARTRTSVPATCLASVHLLSWLLQLSHAACKSWSGCSWPSSLQAELELDLTEDVVDHRRRQLTRVGVLTAGVITADEHGTVRQHVAPPVSEGGPWRRRAPP